MTDLLWWQALIPRPPTCTMQTIWKKYIYHNCSFFPDSGIVQYCRYAGREKHYTKNSPAKRFSESSHNTLCHYMYFGTFSIFYITQYFRHLFSTIPYMIWPSCFGDKKLFWIFPLHTGPTIISGFFLSTYFQKLFWIFPLHTGPTIISGFFLCTCFHHSLLHLQAGLRLWPLPVALRRRRFHPRHARITRLHQDLRRRAGPWHPSHRRQELLKRQDRRHPMPTVLRERGSKNDSFCNCATTFSIFLLLLGETHSVLVWVGCRGFGSKKTMRVRMSPPFSDRTTNKGKHPNNN